MQWKYNCFANSVMMIDFSRFEVGGGNIVRYYLLISDLFIERAVKKKRMQKIMNIIFEFPTTILIPCLNQNDIQIKNALSLGNNVQ